MEPFLIKFFDEEYRTVNTVKADYDTRCRKTG
jgi:hypothetical protein